MKFTLTKERTLPFSIGVAVGIILFYLGCKHDCVPPMNKELATVSITVAAIFAGFDSVNRNTLLNLKTQGTTNLMSSSYRDVLLSYISAMLRSSLWLITICIVYLAMEEKYTDIAKGDALFALWGGVIVWMLLSFLRLHYIMSRLYNDAFPRK